MITQDEAETLVLLTDGDVTKLSLFGFTPLSPEHGNFASEEKNLMVNKKLGVVAKRSYIEPKRANNPPEFAIETLVINWPRKGEDKYSWFSHILFQPLAEIGTQDDRRMWWDLLEIKYKKEFRSLDVHVDNVALYNGGPVAIDW